MNTGVYLITNLENGKAYVGSSVRLSRRLTGHRSDLRGNRHVNQKLQRAWNKYGESAFKFEVIEYTDDANVRMREQHWIDQHLSNGTELYNNSLSAEGNHGYQHSQATKEKIAAAQTGKRHSEETKLKMSEDRKGRVYTEERNRKVAEAKRGKKRGSHSPETKAKMSESHKLRHQNKRNEQWPLS